MSDLKHQTVAELEASLLSCEKYIKNLSSNLAGQKERHKWIKHYLFEKTPQELSITEIEKRLGHKAIIKP